MKTETYYTAQSNTGSNIEILTNWHGGHFDEATFERLEAIANNAIIAYYNKDVFKFIAGDKPRSGADMYDCMPYTDTSDFAAAWAVNWDCRSTTRPAYQLKGVAIARVSDMPEVAPRAVLYWHDTAGADVFEVVGDELPTVEELAAARMREELKAAAGCTFTAHRSTLSARSWSLSLAAVNAAGYTSADGEAVDIWNDAPGGGYLAELVNGSNTIQATTMSQLHPPRSLATVYAWTGEKVAEIRAAFAAAEKARDEYNKAIDQYTAAKVDGFADFVKIY